MSKSFIKIKISELRPPVIRVKVGAMHRRNKLLEIKA
jgi:hypothetical protein